jgi:hypothetical protein
MAAKRQATLAAKKGLTEVKAAEEAAPAEAEVKARKPREKMTDEAKAAMAAKREATLAAKKGAKEVAVAIAAEIVGHGEVPDAKEDGKKARKPREKMTDEAKAAMAAKREATKAAKAAPADATTPPPAASGAKAPGAPKKGKKRAQAEAAEPKPASPVTFYEMVEVDDALFMVHKESKKAYRVDMNETGDARALLDQQVGEFKDGEMLPVFDEEE